MCCVRVTKWIVKQCSVIYEHFSLIKKGIVIGVVICVVELAGFYIGYGTMPFAFWLFEKILLLSFFLLLLANLAKVRGYIHAMSAGDMAQKIDTHMQLLEFRAVSKELEHLKDGFTQAAEDRIKSERFKSELITNVSHDIKTPLTSIINYVGLIEQENVADEKLKTYVEVLHRQSISLKKLIEDLIEASKASTGNIKMNLEPCNVDVLLTQTVGEFEEKLKSRDLNLMLKKEEENLVILADARYLWHVFDNLLNNIYKYAQPGTRVYLNLERRDDKACLIFRNTSDFRSRAI